MRINKYLATCGICSRRKAEELISAGQIKVNGEIVYELSLQISDNDIVEYNGEQVIACDEKVYYKLNKPKGVVSAVSSPWDEETVIDIVKDPHRIFPVGRLDKDSEGLILLTNDGEFANALMHPKYEGKKVYRVKVKGLVKNSDIQKLKDGVVIDGYKTKRCEIKPYSEDVNYSVFIVTIGEGRNRQIRKMFETIDKRVVSLIRLQECGIKLDNLKRGEYRKLTTGEINKALKICKYGNADV